ncbi:MAG TPA: HlyD family efflux transporter periplasmic adaptor subunit [Pirellulales bacterium]|jgi:multidrug resistance efflux pump|nr:HlyD family efflux transporter periplasmic adaptor subunit [Pirellulales bacterium]
MVITSLITTLALALAQAGAATPLSNPVDDKCILASIADVQVAAKEAGVLFSLEAKEGMYVKEGTELGRIDYREAEAELKIKQFDFEVADFKAKSTVSVKYAKKASDVAQKVYEMYEEANRKGQGKNISKTEMMKYKLEWDKAALGIDKEEEEIKSAQLTSKGKSAEVEAARISLDNRQIRSPVSGVVVKVFRHVGEWVAPGDTVFRVVRVDRLKVIGSLDATQYGYSDVEGRGVTVEVSLPRGRSVQVQGKVVAVSPVVGVGLKLPIVAEIESPMEGDQPLVRAGQKASMTIHVNQPPPAAAHAVPPKTKKTS